MQISGSSVHCSCLKSPTLKNDAYTSGLGGFVPCYVKSLKNNAGASEGVLVAKRKCCLGRNVATAHMHCLSSSSLSSLSSPPSFLSSSSP